MAKTATAQIHLDPHHGTPHYHQGISAIEGAVSKCFAKQKSRAIAEAAKILKARKGQFRKSDNDDPDDVSDAINEAIAEDWPTLVGHVRGPLEQAHLAGTATGILQLELHDTKLISSANQLAADYARDRAAELVGMAYDDEGNLIENPNAEWAISDTTRDKIRRVVAEGFQGETDISVIRDRIQAALKQDDAAIFSIDRASTIANTEVATAQAEGNFDVWKKSGMVKKVKWTVSDEEPCDICEDNEDEVRELGKAFDSDDIMPPAHPNCRCVLVAVLVEDDDEEE